MSVLRKLVALFLCASVCGAYGASSAPEHVVVIVCDGLRPDLVTPELAPTIYSVAQRGTFFRKHHSVFVSATIVNGVAIATGCYPERSGVIANREFRPAISGTAPVEMAEFSVVAKGDDLTKGNHIRVPTLAEILQERGERCVVAGAKAVGVMHNRHPSGNSITVAQGTVFPKSAQESVESKIGPFPHESDLPAAAANDWTTRALTDVLWAESVPRYSVLWLSEPDLSQHMTGVGTPVSLAALKCTDTNIQHVIDSLKKKGVEDSTDIYIVSDHGFSTVGTPVNLKAELRKAGFAVASGTTPFTQGELMIANNGGSALIYAADHDSTLIGRVIDFLKAQPFTGAILTSDGRDETFPFAKAMIASPDAPDVAVSYAWDDSKNPEGWPGTSYSEGRKVGLGNHASLSRWDLHNTLIACGPSFKTGESQIPSGNVDVAPTILFSLDIPPAPTMQGRPLREAMTARFTEAPEPVERTVAVPLKSADGSAQSELHTVTVGSTTYIDWGNRVKKP